MVPHGDRRDRSVSGRTDNQKLALPNGNDFMCVFIERRCVQQQRWRLLAHSPRNELLQRAKFRQGALKFV